MTNPQYISDADFSFYQKMLLEKSGLALAQDKAYLLYTRLQPVAHNLGFATLDHMTSALKLNTDPMIIGQIVEAMTTNETLFFRDNKPFQYFKDVVLPELAKRKEGSKVIRIWSAACSSGQEAYSLAMILDEFFQIRPGWTCQIIGTDISNEMLSQARSGEYSQFEVQRGLTIQMMVRYFKQENQKWKINDKLRDMVKFHNLNLLDNLSALGSFDIVFCRNVLIYFNKETKEKVLAKITERLAPGGQLFLGSCETLMGLNTPLESVPEVNNVYRRKT